MTKSRSDLLDDPRLPTRRFRQVVLAALLLAASPLAFDCVRLIVGRWRSMTGQLVYVPTPTLDLVHGWIGEMRFWFAQNAGVWLHDPGWNPASTVTIAALWAVGAGFLLRGFRR